ncbi:MAG: shikimate kinase [Candidatus Omnitrophota bacterium]|nr:shikimate kinase [Candidatus Omnitrophota bacterium]
MIKKNIILVGFMGSGKTTIAIKLSHRLGMNYISIDDMIEKREKATINEIFTKKGEDYFRNVESEVLSEACATDNAIIDAGGGAVLRDENWANMKASGVTICLMADEETIMARTKKYKHRPLLNVEDPKQKIRSLLAKRAPFYAKADHCIDTGIFTVNQVVDKIVSIAESAKEKNA